MAVNGKRKRLERVQIIQVRSYTRFKGFRWRATSGGKKYLKHRFSIRDETRLQVRKCEGDKREREKYVSVRVTGGKGKRGTQHEYITALKLVGTFV